MEFHEGDDMSDVDPSDINSLIEKRDSVAKWVSILKDICENPPTYSTKFDHNKMQSEIARVEMLITQIDEQIKSLETDLERPKATNLKNQ
jgi:hypothetical protein